MDHVTLETMIKLMTTLPESIKSIQYLRFSWNVDKKVEKFVFDLTIKSYRTNFYD